MVCWRYDNSVDVPPALISPKKEKKSGFGEITRAAVRRVADYNSQLAETRRNIRKEYVDTQTNVSVL